MKTQNKEEQRKKIKGKLCGEKVNITRARQLQKGESLEAEMKNLPSGFANAKVHKTGRVCLEEQGVPTAPAGDTLSPSPAGSVISLQHSQARGSTHLGQGSRVESPAGVTVELDPHVPPVRDPVHSPCLANELLTKIKNKKRRRKTLNKSHCLIVGKEGIRGRGG